MCVVSCPRHGSHRLNTVYPGTVDVGSDRTEVVRLFRCGGLAPLLFLWRPAARTEGKKFLRISFKNYNLPFFLTKKVDLMIEVHLEVHNFQPRTSLRCEVDMCVAKTSTAGNPLRARRPQRGHSQAERDCTVLSVVLRMCLERQETECERDTAGL